MNWMEKLYRTYEANAARIGDANEEQPLEPVCHTTQEAHITVVIDGAGNFLRSMVVPKPEAKTLVPATEESAVRSGTKPVCHPLCDKLQYVAGDFACFGGEVTIGYSGDPQEPYWAYVKQLGDWCRSPYTHPKLLAILKYVKKMSLVADLVRAKILYTEANESRLLNQWPSTDDVPAVFKLLPGGTNSRGEKRPPQSTAFVRWSVEIPGDPQADVWTDEGVQRAWIAHCGSAGAQKGVCYVTGSEAPLATQHPAKIHSGAGRAKLISSNDNVGYTFRGRFTSAAEACGVSFEVTQKAHNALRWLIARQGYRNREQAVVAWAVSGAEVPDPCTDTDLLLGKGDAEPAAGYTAQEFATRLRKRMAGYSVCLGPTDEVVVMGVDAAVPGRTAGRMAVTFYRELTGSELLARVEKWHAACCWPQRIVEDGQVRAFVGAPAPHVIARAAYGRRLDDRLCKVTIERLLPCIVEGRLVPRDLVDSCVLRATRRQSIGAQEWEEVLGVACALYRVYQQQHQERSYSMALDRERATRDYLYGRLLALAEYLEGQALYAAGERRETNAGKLMQRFAERPYGTWLTIETALTPYRTRLQTKWPGLLHGILAEVDEAMSKFVPEEFTADRHLGGEFLLGYHCQRADLWRRKPKAADTADGGAESGAEEQADGSFEED